MSALLHSAVNDEGVCRAAPGTPGLVKIVYLVYVLLILPFNIHKLSKNLNTFKGRIIEI